MKQTRITDKGFTNNGQMFITIVYWIFAFLEILTFHSVGKFDYISELAEVIYIVAILLE